jgi:hypothetical protein
MARWTGSDFTRMRLGLAIHLLSGSGSISMAVCSGLRFIIHKQKKLPATEPEMPLRIRMAADLSAMCIALAMPLLLLRYDVPSVWFRALFNVSGFAVCCVFWLDFVRAWKRHRKSVDSN